MTSMHSQAGAVKGTASASTPAHLGDRTKYLGVSQLAAAIGVSSYDSPMAVWEEKTGRREPFQGNRFTEWGTRLEDVVAEAWAEKTGHKIRRCHKEFVDPERPWLRGHIDRDIVGEPAILEVKTGNVYTADQWGEEGTDQIPRHYLVQAQGYLHLTGAERVEVAVLLGGNEFRRYCVTRNDDLIAVILQEADEFWCHVANDTPPKPADAVEASRRIAIVTGNPLEVTPEIAAAIAELNRISAAKKEPAQALKALDAEAKDVTMRLMEMAGDHDVIVGEDGVPLASLKDITQNVPARETTFRRVFVSKAGKSIGGGA